jgi:hypothetical protein
MQQPIRVNIRWLLLFLFALASGSWGATPNASVTPERLTTRFYRTYLRLGISGLPAPKEMATLKPFFTPDLIDLLRAAEREQAAVIKKRPEEKPPWAEGDLFSSLWEGAQSFEVGPAKISVDQAEVPATFVTLMAKTRLGGPMLSCSPGSKDNG